MTDPTELRWAEDRAVAFALGMLDDDDEGRFRAVAATIPELEDLLERRELVDVGHVPAALIARWYSAGRELRGVERELIAEHLKACDSCREELSLFGLRPLSAPAARAGVQWLPWLGGVALGVAATMAFLMFRSPQLESHEGQQIEVVSPRAVRGSDAEPTVLATSTRRFVLAVRLPEDLQPHDPSTLIVHDPEGREISQTPLAAGSFGFVQILLSSDSTFDAGEYRVLLQLDRESEARELGRFRLEIR